MIVTFDLKHFGSEHLERWGVQAQHPRVFLQSLWGLDPVVVTTRLGEISYRRGKPLEDGLRSNENCQIYAKWRTTLEERPRFVKRCTSKGKESSQTKPRLTVKKQRPSETHYVA